MPHHAAKIFSFVEANSLVADVTDLTEKAIHELDRIRRQHSSDEETASPSISEAALKEVEEILQEWSNHVLELGGRPKGYFTVDFQSMDPELLYCWNYGEDRICYTHKVWENFSHRRLLAESLDAGEASQKWVN
jgi:hypothetical protein